VAPPLLCITAISRRRAPHCRARSPRRTPPAGIVSHASLGRLDPHCRAVRCRLHDPRPSGDWSLAQARARAVAQARRAAAGSPRRRAGGRQGSGAGRARGRPRARHSSAARPRRLRRALASGARARAAAARPPPHLPPPPPDAAAPPTGPPPAAEAACAHDERQGAPGGGLRVWLTARSGLARGSTGRCRALVPWCAPSPDRVLCTPAPHA